MSYSTTTTTTGPLAIQTSHRTEDLFTAPSSPLSPTHSHTTTTTTQEPSESFDFSSEAPTKRNNSTVSLSKHYLASASVVPSTSQIKTVKYQGHKKSFSLVRDLNSPPRSPPLDQLHQAASASAAAAATTTSPSNLQSTIEEEPEPSSITMTVQHPIMTQYLEPPQESISSVDFPFLRALHPFNPHGGAASESLTGGDEQEPNEICLKFDEGDLALLHSVHESGWGDATVLSSGLRGWIPTNYFVNYSDEKVVPLLTAILQFVLNPKAYELRRQDQNAEPTRTFSQAAITSIVAGVRSLLEACGTLTRDTPTVKKSQTIRRFRKNLLAELAILVSLAKQHRNSVDDSVIDKLCNGCYKIASKAVEFLDVWSIDINTEDDNIQPYLEYTTIPENPHDLQAASSSLAGPTSQLRARPGRQNHANRESVIFHTAPPLAGQRLEEVNDALSAYLGIFIHRMPYLESNPAASTQILVNTRKSMLACRELLACVEAISSKQQPRSSELEQRKDKLFAQIRGLVQHARDVVATSSPKIGGEEHAASDDENDGVSPAGRKLVEDAIDCARTAGECVVRCRLILNKVGDFQMTFAREYPDFSDGVIAMPSYYGGNNSTSATNNRNSIIGDFAPPSARPVTEISSDSSATPRLNGRAALANITAQQPAENAYAAQYAAAAAAAAAANQVPQLTKSTSIASFRSFTSAQTNLNVNVPTSSSTSTTQVPDTTNEPTPTLKSKNSATFSQHAPTSNVSNGTAASASGLLPQISALSPIIPLSSTENSPSDPFFNQAPRDEMKENVPPPPLTSSTTSFSSSINGATTTATTTAASSQLAAHEAVDSTAYPAELQILMDTASGKIRGGSLQVLINMLTDENAEQDKFLLSMFFLTFRNYATPQEVFHCMSTRYAPHVIEENLDLKTLEDVSGRRVKVFNLFKMWLESYWKQSEDGVVLDDILQLADDHFNKILPNARSKIHDLAGQVTSNLLEDGEAIVPRMIYMPDGQPSRQTDTLFTSPPLCHSLSRQQVQTLSKINDQNGYRLWNPHRPAANQYIPSDDSDGKSIQTSATTTASSAWSSSLQKVRNSTFAGGLTHNNQLSVMDFEAFDIAVQLTMMDSNMFCRIGIEELAGANLFKRSISQSTNVWNMINFTNQLGVYVSDSILGGELSPKQRKNVLKQWIKIAERCHEVKNFNSMVGIISTLHTVNIQRLKKTWDMLSPRYHTIFNNLRDLSSPERNFANYRQQLRVQECPCIPYLGVYTQDLMFLVEGNAKFRKFPLPHDPAKHIKVINFDLYERLTKIVGEVQKFQMPYRYGVSRELQRYIWGEMLRANAHTDQNELWRRSCMVEPKQ